MAFYCAEYITMKVQIKYYFFDYKIITKILTLYLLFLAVLNTHAQNIISLVDGKEDYIVNADVFEVIEDKNKRLTINEISSPLFENFHKQRSDHSFNKNHESAYWLKFSVKNNTTTYKKFLLETYAPHTNQIEVYLPNKNGEYYKQEGGENYKFKQRKYLTKNILFDLPLENDNGKTISTFYIRVLSKNYSAFDYRIKTVNYFLYYITNEYYFLGIYYGILLIMAVYNLMVYLTVKEKVYLYYFFYVLSSALITMTDDGIGFQYIWSNFPSWSRPIGYTIAPLLQLFLFILYSSSFLDLKNSFPLLWKIVFSVTGVYLLYFILSGIFIGHAIPILYTIPFLTVYIVACIAYTKGYKAARYYIIGFTFILLSIIIIQLRAEHIVEGNFFTVYSLNIGLLFEVVIFSYALSDRIKIIKREREKARLAIIDSLNVHKDLQEKVNRELGEKVEERTRELLSKNQQLEDVNQKLIELNDKINNINAKLDYDNWYLKKDIKEDLQARIAEEEVSFEEFEKIFPNEQVCQSYLAVQKWNSHYRCRKCGNLKHTEYADNTKRKCTVCGFVESATAFTLYHGVRFPLNKAFYLTYLFYRKKSNRNVSELADLLGIRRNTCGKFRGKILENKMNYLLQNKNQEPESWEKLIVVKKRKLDNSEHENIVKK